MNSPIPMEAVRESQEVGRRFRRAADSRELGDVKRIDAELVEALDDALGNGVVAAAGAEGGLAALVVQNLEAEAVGLFRRNGGSAHVNLPPGLGRGFLAV